MTNNTYGYVRVSTHEQNEARQLIAMRDFGVAEENIIIEKQSGKDFQRELYLGLVQRLRPGDVLVVKSIDRLGRNYTEILEGAPAPAAGVPAPGGALEGGVHLLPGRRK